MAGPTPLQISLTIQAVRLALTHDLLFSEFAVVSLAALMSSPTVWRSTRLRNTTSISPVQPSSAIPAASAKRALDDATPVVRPKKRRLKAGSLKMVGEMPYEILVEIFSYALEPVDLYNLSRANSVLHALLLSRSLAPALWENVSFVCLRIIAQV